MAEKPVMHGRDHRPGGMDPIPGLGGLPLYEDYTPNVYLTAYGQLSDPSIDVAATWSQDVVDGLIAGYARIFLGSDLGTGSGNYAFDLTPDPTFTLVSGYSVYVGFGWTVPSSLAHPVPAYVDGGGILWAVSAGNFAHVSKTFPGTYSSGDELFSGSWFGRLQFE